MSLALYFDHNMQAAVAAALQERGVDLLTAQEDGYAEKPDIEVLQRATELGRVVVTHDHDFLRLTQERLAAGQHQSGLLFCQLAGVSIGTLIAELELAAKTLTPAEIEDQTVWIPL